MIIVVSTLVITFSLNLGDRTEHLLLEGYGFGLGIFLMILTLRAIIQYKITRMYFTLIAFGFLTAYLGYCSFVGFTDSATPASHFTSNGLVEHFVTAAITAFGAGTLFDINRNK